MNLFAILSLFLWLPIVVAIFASQPPRRAVVISFIVGWLALPNIGFGLPGLPDYTKMSATVMGIVLAAMVFDQKRFFAVRPRWYDAPMIVWCVSPFASAVTSDLGAYEGVSSVMDQCFAWGLPYLIGRVYFQEPKDLRELALGIAIGGLIYAPLCLVEIRLSPVLKQWVYGIFTWEGVRLGGYRPRVFLANGLELGMWMTNATLMSYQLWSCGTVKKLRDVPFGVLTLGLTVTTVLCKSTGALGLLIAGVVTIWVTRKTGKPWLAWILIAIPILYSTTRTFHLWSGREVVDIAAAVIDAERAQSFEFRLQNEEIFTSRAMQRPLFGWGRFGGFMMMGKDGKWLAIIDGYWIITLGLAGTVGLVTLLTIMLLPLGLVLRRFPARTWSEPEVGPAVVLAIMLALVMLDFLSNAMLNPIYALAMGAVIGVKPTREAPHQREAEAFLADAATLMEEGRLLEAGPAFRRAADLASDLDDPDGRRALAEALDGLGLSEMATGDAEAAESTLREAVAVRDRLAAEDPDPDRFRDLAIAREGLSRALVEVGRPAEAIQEREIALRIWDILTANHPRRSELREHRVDALNDLSWLLSTETDPAHRDPAMALQLAEEAVRASDGRFACWNTLGVARYRAGDWPGAIEALERSAADGPDGGTAFDYYFLAMACRRLDDAARAREWFEQGMAWAARHRPGHAALERFREEAETLLRVADHLEIKSV